MGYKSPLYPYRLFITGTDSFNNYFLFRRYMNEYKTNKTFLYAPKHSNFEAMTRLYATCNNLGFLPCDIDKALARYGNYSGIGFKVSEVSDMLIAFWDGKSRGVKELEYAFSCRRKRSIIIDVSRADVVDNSIVLKHVDNATVDFDEVYGKYIDPTFRSSSFNEQAMKFLADAYNNKELMKLIIDNKDKEIITRSKLGEEVKDLLYWIYNNQFAEFSEDYENLIEKELPPRMKRFSVNEYRHAEPCEWDENGAEVDLYTGTGLPLAKGYSTVFDFGQHTYVEIPEKYLIREHIHKSMSARKYTEDEDSCVKITYHTSDTESYPITYQVANFEDSLFKMGNYYISTDFVTTVKPNIKKEEI